MMRLFALLFVGALLVGCETAPQRIEPTAQEMFEQGRLDYARGDLSMAASALEQAVRLDPDLSRAHCLLARVYDEMALDREAVAAYRTCIDLQPGNAEAHAGIGIIFSRQLDYVLAESHLQKAVDLGSQNPRAYYLLAEILRKKGQCSTPVALYKKALALKPGYVDAQEGLRRVRADNCAKPAPPPAKPQPFRGGGKALKPGEW
jgi:Tfp pilus assembly protein PilF